MHRTVVCIDFARHYVGWFAVPTCSNDELSQCHSYKRHISIYTTVMIILTSVWSFPIDHFYFHLYRRIVMPRIIGHRQHHKGQEGRDNYTSREAATTVSMSESLNEEMEIKLSSLSVCCSWFQSLAAANWKEERPRDVCALGTFKRMGLAEWVLYVEDEGCSRYLR
jgi:hypothetical protein